MSVGDNNPRVFAEVIALDAWRSQFDGERAEADLHIDVVFGERGRVGGGDAPVRFRLSLRHAEVHVIRDSEEIMEINRRSVLRSKSRASRAHTVTEKKTQMAGAVGASLSTDAIKLSAKGNADTTLTVTDRLEHCEDVTAMEVTHWKTDQGYAFRIAARQHGRLRGQPWPADITLMRIRDTNSKRRRGEPPEVRIEIQCLREDLIVEDIEFTSAKFPSWATLPRTKQIAVEQYIKDELGRSGLNCGDLSEPFTRIVLGDAVPVVES